MAARCADVHHVGPVPWTPWPIAQHPDLRQLTAPLPLAGRAAARAVPAGPEVTMTTPVTAARTGTQPQIAFIAIPLDGVISNRHATAHCRVSFRLTAG